MKRGSEIINLADEVDEDDVVGPLPPSESSKVAPKKRKGNITAWISLLLINFCCFPIGTALVYLVLQFEETYLRNIPTAEAYEKSFMHRDVVTHVVCTQ